MRLLFMHSVGWGVKLYILIHSVTHSVIRGEVQDVESRKFLQTCNKAGDACAASAKN